MLGEIWSDRLQAGLEEYDGYFIIELNFENHIYYYAVLKIFSIYAFFY